MNSRYQKVISRICSRKRPRELLHVSGEYPLSEAARMIKETDISLNELYISVGYNNANTFRRAFKKIYGVTPSSMRENKADK